MATPKEEKLLSSIDGTLKDILKELKRQNRGPVSTDIDVYNEKSHLNELKKERSIRL